MIIEISLQKELEVVSEWFVDKKLSLHLGKTESILFGSRSRLKSCSCAQFAPGCKFAPGSKFTPGCKFAPPSYANTSCSYVPRFDLECNTRYIVLWSNSLCLNVQGDSDPLSLRVMCVRDISITGWGLKRLHNIHIKARKA